MKPILQMLQLNGQKLFKRKEFKMRQNALWNAKNPNQGKFLKILCLCSAGLLRSPTIAWVLTRESDHNCRAAGIHDFALIQCDEVLLEWADLIICSDTDVLFTLVTKYNPKKDMIHLEIPDQYNYRDPELIEIIRTKLKEEELI